MRTNFVSSLLPLGAAVASAWLAVSIAAAQVPSPPDPASYVELIANFRKSAMRYQGHLPDFICIETTTRSVDATGTGNHLKQRDVLVEQVSFSRGRSVFKLLSINGKPTKKTPGKTGGVIENSLLQGLIVPNNYFGAKAPVTLTWVRWDTIKGKPAEVFSFTVAPSVTNYPDGKTPWLLGMHGLVWASTSDESLIRLESDEDAPPHYPFRNNRTEVDYEPVDIAGTQFVLPVQAVTGGLTGKSMYRNVVKFTNYRKFQAETNVQFDDGPH